MQKNKRNAPLHNQHQAPQLENRWVTKGIIIFVIILAIAWTFEGYVLPNFGRRIGLVDNAMKPIHISLTNEVTGDTLRMRIPKAYLVYKKNWRGGPQTLVMIQTGLPDMKPRPATFTINDAPDSPEFQESLKKLRDGISISLSAKFVDDNFHENSYRRLERDLKILNKDLYGMHHFRREVCRNHDDDNVSDEKSNNIACDYVGNDELIFPLSKTSPKIIFFCVPVDQNPFGGCQAHVQYRNRLLKYIFRRSELYRWQEIDRRVRELLDDFVVTSNNTN